MNTFNLPNLNEEIAVFTSVIDNELIVSVKSKSINKLLLFACYFYINDVLVLKCNYSRLGVFKLGLETSAKLSFRFYVRNKESDIREGRTVNLGDVYIESNYTKRFFIKSINKRNSELGSNLLNKCILSYASFTPIKVEGTDIYGLDPYGNSTWRWYLHQLAHIPYIISYFELEEKIKHLGIIAEYVKSWSKYESLKYLNKDRMLWHDHATAIRLKNIILAFCYLQKFKFFTNNFEDYQFFINIIEKHIQKLSEQTFYSQFTNHGFDQSLFLYHATLEFKNLIPNLTEIIKIAEIRLIDEINYAFCDDGGHKENSPAYLNFGIKQCLAAIEISQSYGCLEEFEHIENILSKATNALMFNVKPDGYLPLIGDTSTYKVVDFFTSFKPSNYDQFKYSISKGKFGKKPEINKLILEQSGYAYFRSSWDKLLFEDAKYLTFKASYHSNYHRHDDDLAITLYAYGQDWLIDGGIFKYDERNHNRKYIRSHNSHSILCPDNVPALRDRENKHEVYLRNLGNTTSPYFHVKGFSKMFKNFLNTREINFISPDEFFIIDECSNICGSLFSCTSRLFFVYSVKVEIYNNLVVVSGAKRKLEILVSSDDSFSLSLISPNKHSPIGWLSNSTNKIIKSQILEIKFNTSKSNKLSCKMKFNFLPIIND